MSPKEHRKIVIEEMLKSVDTLKENYVGYSTLNEVEQALRKELKSVS